MPPKPKPADPARGSGAPDGSQVSHVDKLRALRAESKDKVYFSALHEAQSRRLFANQASQRHAAEMDERRVAERNVARREEREQRALTDEALRANGERENGAPAAAGASSTDGDQRRSAAAVSEAGPNPSGASSMPGDDDAKLPKDKRSRYQKQADEERVHGLAVRLLPFDVVKEQIETILVERWLLRDFILHIPFLTIFMLFFIGRRRFKEEFFAIDAAYKELATENLPPVHPFVPTPAGQTVYPYPYYRKTFEDIGNEDDWYDFLENIAVPKLFATVPTAGVKPQDVRIMSGNIVPIGAYRLRFKHVKDNTCTPNDVWYPPNETMFPRQCYGEYEDGREQRTPYKIEPNAPPKEWTECDNDFLRIQGRFATYDCGGFMIEIPTTTPARDAYLQVKAARDARLAKTLTLRFASIDFIAYSVSASAFLYVRLAIEVTPGGGYMPWNYIRTFRGGGGDVGWLLVDILFGLMVIFAIYRLIEDFRKHYELTGKPLGYFADAWNILSILNTIFFSVSMITHYTWMGLSLATGPIFGEDRTQQDLSTYPTHLAELEEFSKLTLYFNCINAVLSTIVLLKFARTNQRLNILQRTVAGSIGHLLSVLIIFSLIVIAYGVAGNMLFGRVLRDYRTVSEAVVTNFRSLLGDFKYWDLYNTNRFLAFAYFWSFVVLGLFIMLNFIVAILMRGFEEEANKTRRIEFTAAIQKALATSHNVLTNLKITLLNILKGRETPESMLFTGMKSMAQEFTERGEVDFAFVFISRQDFTGAIPPVDVELYGEVYFDELWLRFLNEIDMRRRAKSDKTLSQVSEQVYVHARDAAIDVLYRYHEQIYGIAEKVEDHIVDAVRAERTIARELKKIHGPPSWDLLEEADAARAAFDSEEQRLNYHTWYSVRMAMGNRAWPYVLGEDGNNRTIKAHNMHEIVRNLERRAFALFKVYDDNVSLEQFRRQQVEESERPSAHEVHDHPQIWPEGDGVLRDLRSLLNDVLAEIDAFKQSDVYEQWRSGELTFSAGSNSALASRRGGDATSRSGRGAASPPVPTLRSDGSAFRSRAATDDASDAQHRHVQELDDDDSGWHSAEPFAPHN